MDRVVIRCLTRCGTAFLCFALGGVILTTAQAVQIVPTSPVTGQRYTPICVRLENFNSFTDYAFVAAPMYRATATVIRSQQDCVSGAFDDVDIIYAVPKPLDEAALQKDPIGYLKTAQAIKSSLALPMQTIIDNPAEVAMQMDTYRIIDLANNRLNLQLMVRENKMADGTTQLVTDFRKAAAQEEKEAPKLPAWVIPAAAGVGLVILLVGASGKLKSGN